MNISRQFLAHGAAAGSRIGVNRQQQPAVPRQSCVMCERERIVSGTSATVVPRTTTGGLDGRELDVHALRHALAGPTDRAAQTHQGTAVGAAEIRKFPRDADLYVVIDGANLGMTVGRLPTPFKTLRRDLLPAYREQRVCTVLLHEPILSFSSPIFAAFTELARESRHSELNKAEQRRAAMPPWLSDFLSTEDSSKDEAAAGPVWGSGGDAVTNLATLHYPSRQKNLGDFGVIRVLGLLDRVVQPHARLVLMTRDHRLMTAAGSLHSSRRMALLFAFDQLDLRAVAPP